MHHAPSDFELLLFFLTVASAVIGALALDSPVLLGGMLGMVAGWLIRGIVTGGSGGPPPRS